MQQAVHIFRSSAGFFNNRGICREKRHRRRFILLNRHSHGALGDG